ncbi:hypothetical protein FOA43_004577 [Brettanomyces nanus]|uniref:Zn(2)-C6 fungal-type domain-containing protein n=1 Tax=Eeniella nana TaxID=13502 RepID=A0A875S6F2_EENNA|nr:uncharacterized protein FOA43_004577 [Brettanomyces nanus]QPG77171.1 hypothetical protein FOA43_004577 [Brettanomyces nanus]
MIPMAFPQTVKSTRSRRGCHACKKAKTKCDEKQPICSNCLKSGKKCDYSIKLVWGGRPYKKPKIEKLNVIATLSRKQLNQPVTQIPLPFDSCQNEIVKRSTATVAAAAAATAARTSSISPANKSSVASDIVETETIVKSENLSLPLDQPSEENEVIQLVDDDLTAIPSPRTFLSPSGNLQYLLKMSSSESSTNDNNKSRVEYAFLDESCAPRIYTEPEAGSFDEGIKSMSNVMENIISDDVIQTNPWAFLEDLNRDQLELMSGHTFVGTDLDGMPHSNLSLEQSMETHPCPPADHILTDDDNDGVPYKQLDDFAYDLKQIAELKNTRSSNLHSVPIIYEKKQPHHHRYNHIDYSEKQDDILSHTAALALGSSGIRSPSFSSTSSDSIESIPRGILPLPDMLLNVPYYYESFNFFLNSTSLLLTPADSTIYANNPFKILLPKLAMQNDGLLSILVAFGIAHKNTLLHRPIPTDIVESLMSRALRDLLVLLDNSSTSTSDLTLTLVLLLSSFMAFTFKSDKWRVHVKGARQILLLRGYSKPFSRLVTDFRNDNSPTATYMNNEIKQSRLLYFLIRWFAYIDIFTDLSSPLEPSDKEIGRYISKKRSLLRQQQVQPVLSPLTEHTLDSSLFDLGFDDAPTGYHRQQPQQQEQKQTDRQQEQQIDYNITSDANFIKDESHKDIDYILGFNLKFLPLYSQLCKLIKHINVLKCVHELENPRSEFHISPKVIERSLQVELKFRKLGKIEFDTDYSNNSRSFNFIVASNHCFLLMGLIQLYRRVLQIPRKSKLVQEMSSSISGLTMDFIDTANSPCSLCLILPIFVGGCECESFKDRLIYREKMKELVDQGSPCAAVATEIMEKCWATGRDWNDIMHSESINAVFL